jgi:hypothetical protein
MMKIIRSITEAENDIKSAISKNGHLAQHNYNLYLNYGREGEENVYFHFDRNRGVLGYRKKDIWKILAEPVAPQNEKKDILVQTIDWIFAQKAKKIIMEDFSEELRKDLSSISKNKKWRLCKPSYSLIWPVVDLENWTGGGGDWKRLRNLYNKFFKDNKVEFKNQRNVKVENLKKLIMIRTAFIFCPICVL